MLSGIPVVVTESAMVSAWIFPKERFWDYGDSKETERWCRYFGYGHEELHPGAYWIGGILYLHPVTAAQIPKS